MLKKLFIASLFLLSGYISRSQSFKNDEYSKLHIGLGFGMDYGGMGFKVEYLPIKYVGIFGGAGYNFSNLGVNAGLQFRPLPDKKFQPLLMAMYGYNGVLKIKGDEYQLQQLGLDGISKTYYGFSAGVGGELRVGANDNRLFFGLWLPFRSSEFHDNYDIMKASPYVDTKTDLLPVAFSIGFNFAL